MTNTPTAPIGDNLEPLIKYGSSEYWARESSYTLKAIYFWVKFWSIASIVLFILGFFLIQLNDSNEQTFNHVLTELNQ